ncbi:MAG: hypothetical protein AABW61_01200 [Candidatus Aenigmatarchaeota archaeon]
MPTFHYIPKQISEVKPTDSRVSLIGNVVNVGENSFILDDGTGKIEVISEMPVERNKLFRVFCSVIDEKLKADVVQDMEGLDLNLFKKVKELYNSSGV